MTFQRGGGRKRIVAPDGSELTPSPKPQPDGTLVKALARALAEDAERGMDASVSETGDVENISKSRRAVSLQSSDLVSADSGDLGDRP
jgi:hypothetical protein